MRCLGPSPGGCILRLPGKVRVQLHENKKQVCQITANDFQDPRDAIKAMNKIFTACSEGHVSSQEKGLYVLRDKILKEELLPKRDR